MNRQHEARIRDGATAWNQWRDENPEITPDLTDDYLVDPLELSGYNLSGAILTGLWSDGSNFSGSDLERADLVGGRFSRASFLGAFLERALLDDCTLHAADLSGASLRHTSLRNVNLHVADLSRADLTGADLRGADLRSARLRMADLSESDLTEADLTAADLTGATISSTTLVGATLRKASLMGARLSHVDLRRTELHSTVVGGTWFDSVKLRTGEDGLDFRSRCYLDPASASSAPATLLRSFGWPEPLVTYWPSITGVGVQLYSGFISYSQVEPDRAFASQLHDLLQECGIRVWRDEHELVPGDVIMKEIDRGIRLWDKTLLCCSRESLNSWWVHREIEKAVQKERQLHEDRGENVVALIPLDLDGYLRDGWEHEYKSLLTERLVADFTRWDTDSAHFGTQFERLVRAMTPGGGKPPPPTQLL